MKEKKLDIKQQLEAVKNMKDSEIDYSDSSDMGDADWAKFKPFTNTKNQSQLDLIAILLNISNQWAKGIKLKLMQS